jgi:cytochrome b subunit of formate dehydrogenase
MIWGLILLIQTLMVTGLLMAKINFPIMQMRILTVMAMELVITKTPMMIMMAHWIARRLQTVQIL